jgi:hypothetical protein
MAAITAFRAFAMAASRAALETRAAVDFGDILLIFRVPQAARN